MDFLKNKNFYFLLSFIEGGSVMATELLGAKMLAPYFGSSLYVWATVLAITLGGLAGGYFSGGILSYKSKNQLTLFYVLLIAAAFTILMPFTSRMVLQVFGMYSLVPAVIVCSCCILFPPVFMMGMVSPLIIRSIIDDIKESGRVAGAIYAISTVGGIIATFLFGFFIIPSFGLTIPSIITGIVLGFIPAIILLKKKHFLKITGFFLLCIWAFSSVSVKYHSNIKVTYSKEGLLGQLQVLDLPHTADSKNPTGYNRSLYINRIAQTMYDSLADESKGEDKYYPYMYRIEQYADSFPKNSNALVLGLGGGIIASQLYNKGFYVDACELDERMIYISKNYFHLDKNVNVTIDDARHFIRTCKKKYNLIVIDLFRGEDLPNHVFTLESLDEIKNMLQEDGSVIVNGFGYFEGDLGLAMRSIYKTFLASGFRVELLSTDKDPDNSNLIFFASLTNVKPNADYIAQSKIDLNDAIVLSDEYPVLDMLNSDAAKRWRQLAITGFNSYAGFRSLPVFK